MEVYIYGAGVMGENIAHTLLDNGIVIKAFIDKNLAGKKVLDVDVISLDSLPAEDKNSAIFAIAVNKYPFNEIKMALETIGCKKVMHVGDLVNLVYKGPSIANTWVLDNVTNEEKEKLDFVYNNYSDDCSRAAVRQAIAWIKDRVEIVEESAMCDFDSKYFIDKICAVLTDNETFIDCGSYDGGSIAKMLKHSDCKYNKIYAFEPNEENYAKLLEFVKDKENIITYNSGLGNVDGEKKFTSNLSLTSRYSDDYGDVYCRVNKLDTIMENNPYTFLKIYGIGNGLEVIKGGINTIKKYRPIITSNIHHSRDNFINIPYYLMKNLEDYNFYLRLHGYVGSDITIYAIPKERSYES